MDRDRDFDRYYFHARPCPSCESRPGVPVGKGDAHRRAIDSPERFEHRPGKWTVHCQPTISGGLSSLPGTNPGDWTAALRGVPNQCPESGAVCDPSLGCGPHVCGGKWSATLLGGSRGIATMVLGGGQSRRCRGTSSSSTRAPQLAQIHVPIGRCKLVCSRLDFIGG
jgi:hypothetical protein